MASRRIVALAPSAAMNELRDRHDADDDCADRHEDSGVYAIAAAPESAADKEQRDGCETPRHFWYDPMTPAINPLVVS